MIHSFFIIIAAFNAAIVFSQASFNIDLLAQKNDHHAGGMGPDTSYHYSSGWGYTHPNGREYAILGCWDCTAIYDITDAPNVVECDTVPGPPVYYNYREFTVVGNYLYVVSEGRGPGEGLQIINLSYLPDSVHLVRTWTNGQLITAHTIKSSGNYLYLNGSAINSGGVVILDVTNRENPVQLGNGPGVYSHDCFILNDTVFTANIFSQTNCMTILNAVNKNNPTVVTQFSYPDPGTHNVWATPDRKWLVTTDEINIGRKARLWNIQNLNNITFVYEYTPYQDATVHNAYFKNYTLYLAHYKAGVVVLDCSNLPAQPAVIGYYDTYFGVPDRGYNGAWNVYPYYNSGKFIVSDMHSGLWVFKLSGSIGIISNGTEIPKGFKLEQNYPNPFNPATKIKFSLPEKSSSSDFFVKLFIYDITGKAVSEIFNGNLKPGIYTADFNSTGLSSGFYFYKLEAIEESGKIIFSETKKMAVLK